MISPGFKLPNPWVIHVVASSFVNHSDAPQTLVQALEFMMKVAGAHNISSLAMPAISTGIYRCPPELSASLTVRVLSDFALQGTSVEWVRICVANESIREPFSAELFRCPSNFSIPIVQNLMNRTQKARTVDGVGDARKPLPTD